MADEGTAVAAQGSEGQGVAEGNADNSNGQVLGNFYVTDIYSWPISNKQATRELFMRLFSPMMMFRHSGRQGVESIAIIRYRLPAGLNVTILQNICHVACI